VTAGRTLEGELDISLGIGGGHMLRHRLEGLRGEVLNGDRFPLRIPGREQAAAEQTAAGAVHVLFPTEFLPALDLLDRGLVTRFRIRDAAPSGATAPPSNSNMRGSESGTVALGQQQTEEDAATIPTTAAMGADAEMADADAGDQHTTPGAEEDEEEEGGGLHQANSDAWAVYYVRSAQQQRSSRYSASVDTTTSYEVRLRAWNCSCPAFAFAAFPAGARDWDWDWDRGLGLGDADGGGWRFGGLSGGKGAPPVCKHLLACVLVERCELFEGYVQEREVSVEEAVGWAAGWGD